MLVAPLPTKERCPPPVVQAPSAAHVAGSLTSLTWPAAPGSEVTAGCCC